MKTKSEINILQLERVNIFRRGIAAILDIYISSVLAHVPILFIYSIETGETQITKQLSSLSKIGGISACLLGILMVLLYYVILPVYKFEGQTLAKRLLGFKVVKMDDSPVDLNTMLKREAIGSMIVEGGLVSSGDLLRQLILIITGLDLIYTGLLHISFATTILSIIFAVFSKKNRALHDYIGDTKVLSIKEEC